MEFLFIKFPKTRQFNDLNICAIVASNHAQLRETRGKFFTISNVVQRVYVRMYIRKTL